MADKSEPVFRDFLGAGLRIAGKQPEFSITDSIMLSQHSGGLAGGEDGEVSTRACSIYSSSSVPAPVIAAASKEFLNLSERCSESWQRDSKGLGKSFREKNMALNGPWGNKMTRSPNGSPLREPVLLNKSCSDALQSSKVSLFHEMESNAGGPKSISQENSSLRQLPLESSGPVSIWLQTSLFKSDLTTSSSKRVKCSNPSVFNLASSSKAVATPFLSSSNHLATSENTASGSILCQMPGDEGSRTGIQGLELANLFKMSATEIPSELPQASPFLHHLNLASGNVSTVSTCGHQISAPVSRSLTVFYGGQAHVFDDVTPEKVDAIMMVAGSNGLSWSTVYIPRASVGKLSSGNDIPLTNTS